jgi:hypothetical protein
MPDYFHVLGLYIYLVPVPAASAILTDLVHAERRFPVGFELQGVGRRGLSACSDCPVAGECRLYGLTPASPGSIQ